MLFWKDVGNGILLDRPLPFKLHQSYLLLPCFIRKKSGRVPRNADSFLLQIPCKKSAVMTLTPRSASHYRGDALMRLSSQPYSQDTLFTRVQDTLWVILKSWWITWPSGFTQTSEVYAAWVLLSNKKQILWNLCTYFHKSIWVFFVLYLLCWLYNL